MRTKFTLFSFFLFLAVNVFAQTSTGVKATFIGRYSSNQYNKGGSEIVAYDSASARLFSVNAATGSIDIIDLSTPATPTFIKTIALNTYGKAANSVSFKNGLLVAAVEDTLLQNNGKAVFFDNNGTFKQSVVVGALPDMLTFTPDGNGVLVANEGEPNATFTNDPVGSVSYLKKVTGDTFQLVKTFILGDALPDSATRAREFIRISAPNKNTPEKDLEPEYISLSEDGKKAFVVMQENNAMAVLDLDSLKIVSFKGLGVKNHGLQRNGLDASDRGSSRALTTYNNLFGVYMPDGIATYKTADNQTRILMANEGDGRDYTAFKDEKRVSTLTLDSLAFPNRNELKNDTVLGRLTVMSDLGDVDNDGDYDALYAFGSRSFSMRDSVGNLVYDSKDDFERFLSAEPTISPFFNADHTKNTAKDRSDNKGPEPEGIAVAKLAWGTFAFIGLERTSAIMVYNIGERRPPYFTNIINSRNYTETPALGKGGDLGPEGLIVIPKNQSRNGKDLLVVGNEVSGTIAIYELDFTSPTEEVFTPASLQANVFPNPTASDLTLNFQLAERADRVQVNLTDIAGRTVATAFQQSNVAEGEQFVSINSSQLPNGIYFVQIAINGKTVKSLKVSKM